MSIGATASIDGYKIDTNVFVVKFSSLSKPKPVHTGDPVVCSNKGCTAVLNHLSYIREEPGKDDKVTTSSSGFVKDGACLYADSYTITSTLLLMHYIVY